jgi:hypothetical protein
MSVMDRGGEVGRMNEKKYVVGWERDSVIKNILVPRILGYGKLFVI